MQGGQIVQSLKRRFNRYFLRDTPLYASSLSLVACVILAGGSLLLGLFQRSLIIQTNGMIALIDVGNSILFLAAVERSSRGPDLAFNYGYGKYESLAVLVSANLLVILGVFTLIEAINLFQSPPENTNAILLTLWAALSFLIMRQTAKRLDRYANRFHQPMLRYDARLWRVDSIVEVGVVVAVIIGGLIQLAGYYDVAVMFDGVFSIALILITLKVPLQHGRDAFRQLLDRTLPDRMQYEILGVIADNTSMMCEFKSVHTRQSGRDIFIELDVVMPYDYSLEELYAFEQHILGQLHGKFPTAVPRVYITPCDHSCDLPKGSACPIRKLQREIANGSS